MRQSARAWASLLQRTCGGGAATAAERSGTAPPTGLQAALSRAHRPRLQLCACLRQLGTDMPKREWNDDDDDAEDVLGAAPLWSKPKTTFASAAATPAASGPPAAATGAHPERKHNKKELSEVSKRIRRGIDHASRTGDAFAGLALFDEAVAESAHIAQHSYNVLLYLCGGNGEGFGQKKGSGYYESAAHAMSRPTYSEEQRAHLRARMGDIFEHMQKRKIPPTEMTFTALARAAAAGGAPERAAAVASEALRAGVRPKLRTFSPAIHAYVAAGDVDGALNVAKAAEAADASIELSEAEYGALLSACAMSNKAEQGWDLVSRMRCKITTLRKLPTVRGEEPGEDVARVLCGEADDDDTTNAAAAAAAAPLPSTTAAPAAVTEPDTEIADPNLWPHGPRGLAAWFQSETAKAASPGGAGYAVWRAQYDGTGNLIEESSQHIGSSPGANTPPPKPPARLIAVDLHEDERQRLLGAIEAHAMSRESNIPGMKGKNSNKKRKTDATGNYLKDEEQETPASSFRIFKGWLEAEHSAGRRYNTIIDGANAGMANQSGAKGSFNIWQIEHLRKLAHRASMQRWHMLRETEPDAPPPQPPLIVLHKRRVQSGPAANHKGAQRIIKEWKNQGFLYESPYGSNDDWYWLYATVFAGRGALLVTNDELRDHVFNSLRAEGFLKWKERHIARFDLGSEDFRMAANGDDGQEGGAGGAGGAAQATGTVVSDALSANGATLYPPLAHSVMAQKHTNGAALFPLVATEDGNVEPMSMGAIVGADSADARYKTAQSKALSRRFESGWIVAVPLGK